MKAVSPLEELKHWFDLSNYEQVETLTLKELHKELVLREWIMDGLDFGWADDDENLKSILNGNPLLSKKLNLKNYLNQSKTHIEQMSFKDVHKLEETLIIFAKEAFNDDRTLREKLSVQPITRTMREAFLRQQDSKVYVSFDLDKSSDEEILSSLQKMLPVWRKEYEINPRKTEKYGVSKIKKIFDHKIIPMMDLLIWATIKEITLSNMILSRVLYPDFTGDIRGEDHIKDTDRPIAEKSLRGETSRLLEHFIIKNEHLGNVPISHIDNL